MHNYINLLVTLKKISKYEDYMHSAVTDYVFLKIFGKPLSYQMNFQKDISIRHKLKNKTKWCVKIVKTPNKLLKFVYLTQGT